MHGDACRQLRIGNAGNRSLLILMSDISPEVMGILPHAPARWDRLRDDAERAQALSKAPLMREFDILKVWADGS